MAIWIYNVFTYAIIGMALFATVKKIYSKFYTKQKPSSCDSGCNSCSTKCELKGLVDAKKPVL